MVVERNLNIALESARCYLCHNAVCTAACKKGLSPAKGLRAIRFENAENAGAYFSAEECKDCEAPCEDACIHTDFPIRIKEVAKCISKTEQPEADLSIDFCGVKCENPFFLSSSIIASNYEMCAKAFDMGWAGAVFKTISAFVPQEVSPRFDAIAKEATPFIGFKNLEQISDKPLEENLETLRRLKEDYPSKVIVASIMGRNEEEWTYMAQAVTKAGVDIIECNFSCPHMNGDGLGSDVGQNPELVKKYTIATKRGTNLPVLAKMTPNLGHMEPSAIAAIIGGADGIAAINTIKSLTAINLERLTPTQSIKGKSSISGYSGKAVKPIALRFICDLGKCDRVNVPISGMGGIETWQDALEFMLLGCENIQITTSVMQYGYRIIEDLCSGLKRFMAENNFKRLKDIVGKSLDSIVTTDSLNRNTIKFPLFSREKCIGCGRCYLACFDAGHQAIDFDDLKREPILKGKKCVGCHLCRLVCPVSAIGAAKRIEIKNI